MPRLQELIPMLLDQTRDLVELPVIEAVIGRQGHGIQPKPGFVTASLDMNVRRLLTFVAENEESVRSPTEDGWHLEGHPGLELDSAYRRLDRSKPKRTRMEKRPSRSPVTHR